MLSEREKMLAGEWYESWDEELVRIQRQARRLCRELNACEDDDWEARAAIFRKLVGSGGEDLWIEPPFRCDYGVNIKLGSRVFFNFNCVVLDSAEVKIGDDVLIGPAVQIYTVNHPLDAEARVTTWLLNAKPVEIGSKAWIGGGTIICPGVKIGARSVIGAGSVVTRDIPEGVLAVGNPCRVIRPLGKDEERPPMPR